jgi:nicotinamidase-related amidase
VPTTALLVIDMLNTYEHADAEKLIPSVRDVVPNIATLVERARDQDVPVIYVNDNFGSWNADRHRLVEAALEGPHGELVEPIVPDDESMFVYKARHSAFYQTPLEYLLSQEGIGRVVLTGQVTEQCILYSALDAYIRHLEVAVPRDATAHIFEELAVASLQMMQRNMSAEIAAAADIDLRAAGAP